MRYLKQVSQREVFRDFSIILFILGMIILVFRLTSLDLILQRYFYSTQRGWLLQYKPFWDFIYRFGIFPGYFMAFAGLIMISVSYWNTKYIKFRKASLLLIFTIIVGPGLLINLVLKDHTDRPRPREITEFGGTEKYLCVCEKGETNEGKSFPCGHCSMGFYLAIPYLFLRHRRKLLAWSFLTAGIVYGIVIGIARMMAGGHFASDVLMSGVILWLVALAGYYLFRLDKPDKIPGGSEAAQKKKARRVTLVMGILLPVITIGLMLATPYFSSKYFDVSRSGLKQADCRVMMIDLLDATVKIYADTDFHVDYKVNAFGFPNSKIRGYWKAGDTCRYTIQDMGWFTEVKNVVNLGIPVEDSIRYVVTVNHGKIICELPDSSAASFRLVIGKGDLSIAGHASVEYDLKDGKVVK